MKLVRLSQKELVGNWRFDNVNYPGRDYSPKGNDGTLNGPTIVDGFRHGKALEFDGVDDYVEVPDSSSLDITDEITISTWVKFDEVSADTDIGIVSKDSSKGRSYSLSLDDANNFKIRWLLFPETMIHSDSAPSIAEWYHIVGTWDGSTMKLYVNKVQQKDTAAFSGPIDVTTAPLWIGAYYETSRNINGTIDSVRIYNRALSEEEIKMLYSLGLHPQAVKPKAKVV